MATNIGSGILLDVSNTGSGTGNYDSFLRIQRNTAESGFNTDTSGQLDNKDGSWTHSIQLQNFSIVTKDGVDYYELRLDLNEGNASTDPQITLQDLKIYWSDAPATTSASLSSLNNVFDLSGSIALVDVHTGSGTDDYVILIPKSLFAGADPSDYFTLYADFGRRSGSGSPSDGGFEEFRAIVATESAPAITVVKTASPATVNEGSTNAVTYTYVLTSQSSATDPLTIVTLTDDNGTAATGDDFTPTYVSGDSNANSKLDSGEIWTYSYTVQGILLDGGQTRLNVASVSATDDEGVAVSDTDDAVVTALDVLPAITITKVADPTSLAEGTAGDVTYTYTLTSQSASTDPLTILSLVDDNGTAGTGDDLDLLSVGSFTGGDSNANGLLDSNETWTYTYTALGVILDGGTTLTNVATVRAQDDEGNQTSDTDDATVTGDNVNPAITVVKTASPISLDEGTAGNVTYTYTLTSQSASTDPLSIDSLIDDNGTDGSGDDIDVLADGLFAGGDSNNNGKLDNNETWTYTYTVENILLDGGETRVNVASVTATDDEGNEAGDSDDATVTGQDVLPGITLAKTANPVQVDEGASSNVTYTYTLTSQSASTDPLALVSLVDNNGTSGTGDDLDILSVGTFAGGDSDNDGLLDSDETWTYTYTATGVVLDGGLSLANIATVTAQDDEGNETSDTDDAVVSAVDLLPAITLTKSASPTSVAEGSSNAITYTYTLTSQSASTDALTITSLADDNGTADGGDDIDLLTEATFEGGDTNENDLLDAGETWTYSLVRNGVGTDLDAGDELTNVATVSATDNEGNETSDEDSATVTAEDSAPAITLSKTADKTSIDEGTPSDITYTYVLTSQSASTDPLSIVSLVDDNGTADDSSDDIDLLVDASFEGGDDNSNELLDSGETWTYTYVRSGVSANAGSLTNVAVVSGIDDEGNEASDDDDATVTVNNAAPAINLVKSADPTTVTEGSSNAITYTYTLTSQSVGADPLAIVSLVDDNGTANDAGDDVDLLADATFEGGDTNDNGLLDAGETWTYSLVRNGVGGNMNAGDELTNTAVVTALDDEESEASDEDDATVTADDANPAITLVKEADTATVTEGSSNAVTYTYTLTSQSASTDPLSIDSLIDDNGTADDTSDDVDLLADGTFVGGDSNGNDLIDSDETWVFTHVRNGVGEDMNAGDALINTASVSATDDEGNEATSSDTATVTAENSNPAITLVKTADKESIDEGTPSNIGYAYTLNSQSASTDPLSIDSLVDDNGTASDTSDDIDLLADGTFVGGDTDGDGLLDSDETWVFTYDRTGVTLNSGSLTNTAVVNATDDEGNEATASDDATVAVNDVQPGIDIVKVASPAQVQAGVATSVTFTYSLTNQSTTSTDPLMLTALIDDNATASDASDDIDLLAVGTFVGGDTNGNALLDSGETWIYSYTGTVTMTSGSQTNIVSVTAEDDEGNSVGDSASAIVSAYNLGRTPGFWHNNGAQLWDGKGETMPKAGTLGIVQPGQDLAYAIKDINGDGVIGAGETSTGSKNYLMIGDWNFNGIADPNENVLVITRSDAMSLLNASQKQQQDGRFVLSRDMVASWLNVLGGSYAGDSNDPNSARHYIDEATAWLIETTTNHNHVLTVSELTSASAAKQSSAAWLQGFDFDGDSIRGENMVPTLGQDDLGPGTGLDIMSGSAIHAGLDNYNNTGWII